MYIARMRADDAAARDLSVARPWPWPFESADSLSSKQQLGEAFIAPIGNRPSRGATGEQALLDLDALRLGLVFGQANPGDLRSV